MFLKQIKINSFRGVNTEITVDLNSLNSIVGQNDAGKSTILRALDAVLRETTLSRADYNVEATSNQIKIELIFDCKNKHFLLGEEIETSIEAEELTNENGLLVWQKIWNVTENAVSKPRTFIIRKKYEGNNDFIFKTEPQLISLCGANGIATAKGNGENYNNVEKRQKLREFYTTNGTLFTYEYDEIPATGNSKSKSIGDAIKSKLPDFQYFKADSSLSDTDNAIQKYFKEKAFKLINSKVDTKDIEAIVKSELETILNQITSKINEVVKSTERVEPKVDFDWSKLISTSFVSTSTGNNIPLSSRGDGFRRITMMSYFEYLAEEEKGSLDRQIIFGFEEPETFLHPTAQENLFEKLSALADKGYQVVISTHSPIIVGNSNKKDIIHITKPHNEYTINQSSINFKELAIDLGIKPDNTFSPLFSTSRLLFLVEGIDDVNAMHHMARLYKQEGKIDLTFDELSINIIPIGGCGGVKHWVNLDLFTKLEKPFYIFLDSDKETIDAISENEKNLIEYGLTLGNDFSITKKRLLENYMHPTALKRLVPMCEITLTDFCHAKNLCGSYPDDAVRGRLGGKKVAEHHYCNLTFDELRLTWCVDEFDEFIELYEKIKSKIE